jgi:N-acyl-D-amino-acid deacylase
MLHFCGMAFLLRTRIGDVANTRGVLSCEHSDVTPDGIDFVLVNGQVVIDHGKHTGLHPGKALYGPGYTK